MNRRTFAALGAGVVGAAVFARFGFPRYRVRMYGRMTGALVGEWVVSAVERHAPPWDEIRDHPADYALWIDPWSEKAGAEGGYGVGRADDPHGDRAWKQSVCVYGPTPWGDEDATGALIDVHGGLGISWERVA
jgi:hypothetical protein